MRDTRCVARNLLVSLVARNLLVSLVARNLLVSLHGQWGMRGAGRREDTDQRLLLAGRASQGPPPLPLSREVSREVSRELVFSPRPGNLAPIRRATTRILPVSGFFCGLRVEG